MLYVYKAEIGNSNEQGECILRVSHSKKVTSGELTATLEPEESVSLQGVKFPLYTASVLTVSGSSSIVVGMLMWLIYCPELEYGALASCQAEPVKLAERLLLRLEQQRSQQAPPPDPPHDGRDLWAV